MTQHNLFKKKAQPKIPNTRNPTFQFLTRPIFFLSIGLGPISFSRTQSVKKRKKNRSDPRVYFSFPSFFTQPWALDVSPSSLSLPLPRISLLSSSSVNLYLDGKHLEIFCSLVTSAIDTNSLSPLGIFSLLLPTSSTISLLHTNNYSCSECLSFLSLGLSPFVTFSF